MTTSYAESESQAQERYTQYSSVDPFPAIPPALLNSADIADYVRVTGMIFPFNLGDGKLKTASYEIDFDGDIYLWEKDSGEPNKVAVGRGGERGFTLPRNSIAFFSPRTLFRIPNYIALRFNLRIKHVHRGLLLGTGPLVDPGFQGPLLIPLHNLTSTDYALEAGEGLIWVEFTKISPQPTERERAGDGGQLSRSGPISVFPSNKINRPAEEYLSKAAPHHAIRSSVIDLDLRVTASEATIAERVKGFEGKLDQFTRIGWLSGIGLVVAIVGLGMAIWNALVPVIAVVQDASKYVRETEKSVTDTTDAKYKALDARIGKLEEEARLRVQVQQRPRVPDKGVPRNQ